MCNFINTNTNTNTHTHTHAHTHWPRFHRPGIQAFGSIENSSFIQFQSDEIRRCSIWQASCSAFQARLQNLEPVYHILLASLGQDAAGRVWMVTLVMVVVSMSVPVGRNVAAEARKIMTFYGDTCPSSVEAIESYMRRDKQRCTAAVQIIISILWYQYSEGWTRQT